MQLDSQKIKDILVRENYLTAEEIAQAENEAKKDHTVLIDYLLSRGLVTKELLGQAIAECYKIPYIDLEVNPPAAEQVLLIPEVLAKKYHCALVKTDKDNITVATDQPANTEIVRELQTIFPGKKINIAYASADSIEALYIYYRKSLETRFAEIIKTQTKIAPEIINEIIHNALLFHASDIHLEPHLKEVMVRFRIDGVLHEAGKISREFYDNILNFVKVESGMRIDEHFSAQDGAIRFVSNDNKDVDLRVSVIPTLDGEKVAIRVLSEYIRSFTFADLGLSLINQSIINQSSRKPFGMIVVTGPTGSGKSTTLYALMRILNSLELNITTIEDPVEYKINGVNQIQVNTQTNLTFAQGLRSIVRQDPDIILVGEIRDLETAEISVNAALTGHLLFSTFHSNDAATAIPRLLDMGVEPFLLASTLEIIIAQRLVRKICENCRFSQSKTLKEINKVIPNPTEYFPKKGATLYSGKGCKACNNLGYKGRIAIFEIIKITSEMQDLILRNPSTKQVWEVAKKQGSYSLFEDGIGKVKSGTTTLEELIRVAPPH